MKTALRTTKVKPVATATRLYLVRHGATQLTAEDRIVGKDAKFLGSQAYDTDSFDVGVGESFDAIFMAPPHSTGVVTDPPDVYVLYNRRYTQVANLVAGGFGGQRTEVRVYPSGALNAQAYPNDWALKS